MQHVFFMVTQTLVLSTVAEGLPDRSFPRGMEQRPPFSNTSIHRETWNRFGSLQRIAPVQGTSMSRRLLR